MQKQYVISLEPPHSPIAGCEESCIAVYLASEVDARIAELERVGAEYIARTDPLLDQLEPLSNRIAELEKQLRRAEELFQDE